MPPAATANGAGREPGSSLELQGVGRLARIWCSDARLAGDPRHRIRADADARRSRGRRVRRGDRGGRLRRAGPRRRVPSDRAGQGVAARRRGARRGVPAAPARAAVSPCRGARVTGASLSPRRAQRRWEIHDGVGPHAPRLPVPQRRAGAGRAGWADRPSLPPSAGTEGLAARAIRSAPRRPARRTRCVGGDRRGAARDHAPPVAPCGHPLSRPSHRRSGADPTAHGVRGGGPTLREHAERAGSPGRRPRCRRRGRVPRARPSSCRPVTWRRHT